MIIARVLEVNRQGAGRVYLQLSTTNGTENVIAECHIDPSDSVAAINLVIAGACRQALFAAGTAIDNDEPVRLIGGIADIA